MNTAALRPHLAFAASFAWAKGQAFTVGWLEGCWRHKFAAGEIIPGSRFPAPSVEYAASQAAVAYCIAQAAAPAV